MLVALKAVAEAAVAVINRTIIVGLIGFNIITSAMAAILPEERADVMYHSYDGGGITIDGPSVLVRKSVNSDVSVSAQYYVDQISSASIDVMATASPYSEERTEYTFSADYLVNKTLISGGYTNSTENDYDANTYFFGISQDFFGSLSTLDLSFSYGEDDVGNVTDSSFSETAEHRGFQFSWTQVVTRSLLMNFNYHIITDKGFLNNPYRTVRYYDPGVSKGYSYQLEQYPETRSSQAIAVKSRYFLSYRAAIGVEYRYYTDTWEIDAHNLEFNYTHPWRDNWTFEVKYRFYTQNAANFYSDLFAFENAQRYLARDKELSEFESTDIGFAISYEFQPHWFNWAEKGSINLAWDFINFDYSNFRDVTQSGYTVGSEPTYSFDADVIRLYFSLWF